MKAYLLAGVASLVIATSVMAQTGTTTSSTTPDTAAEDIVVRGLRLSLGSAQERKRNSDAILDAVVAEDIGKLPDNNAAEAVARIPGVQIRRDADDVDGVLIRGLPDVATTINGREIFTTDGRSASLNDVPAGALAGLEIYKSGTANIVEAGLAGLINIRTRQPFDFEGREIAGSARTTYNDQSKLFDPHINMLISDRSETSIGEIGGLINVAYTQQQYQNAIRFVEAGVVKPRANQSFSPASVGPDIQFPNSAGLWYKNGLRYRPAANAAVQWKPNDSTEVYLDGLWQGFRGVGGIDNSAVYFTGDNKPNSDPALSNIVLEDGEPNKISSFTATGGRVPSFRRSTDKNQTNTFQFGGGVKWTTGRAKLSTDLAYTLSKYEARNWSYTTAFSRPVTVDMKFNVERGGSYDIKGIDPADPASYILTDYYEGKNYNLGKGWQWRGDIELETDLPILNVLQFGARYTTQQAKTRSGNREAYLYDYPTPVPLASVPVGDLKLVKDGFRSDIQPFQNFLMPSVDDLRSKSDIVAANLASKVVDLSRLNPNDVGYAREAEDMQRDEVVFDPRSGLNASEKSYAVYGQVKYNFEAGIPIDGLLGVRIVNTTGYHTAYSRIATPETGLQEKLVVLRQNYVDVLPNFSARLKFMPTLQLRLGFTKTRTRPGFGSLSPSFNIEPNRDTGRLTGSGGNPELKPIMSKNYDASLEYYFGKTGAASFAVFYRDINGFITNLTDRGTFIPLVTSPVDISLPFNAGKGKIKGAEANLTTFFDFLPEALNGFGAQINATYVDGSNAFPVEIGGPAQFFQFTGVSKWTYNLTGFYEKDGLAIRVSYNKRNDYVSSYSRTENEETYAGEMTRGTSRLDVSASYDVAKWLTLTVDVSNLLAQPFENYRFYNQTQSYPRDIREEGRYIGFGARFRM